MAGIESVGNVNFSGTCAANRNSNKNKMSTTAKGALIGAGMVTTGAGILASFPISVAKSLDKYKGKSIREKREFLKSIEIEGSERVPCFSKSVRNTVAKIKNPLNWLIISGIGATLGAIIGYLCKDSK